MRGKADDALALRRRVHSFTAHQQVGFVHDPVARAGKLLGRSHVAVVYEDEPRRQREALRGQIARATLAASSVPTLEQIADDIAKEQL